MKNCLTSGVIIRIVLSITIIVIALSLPLYADTSKITDDEYRLYLSQSPALKKADQELTTVYNDLLKSLPPATKDKLRREEREWIRQRDKQLITYGMEKGMDGYLNALVQLTQDRADEFKKALAQTDKNHAPQPHPETQKNQDTLASIDNKMPVQSAKSTIDWKSILNEQVSKILLFVFAIIILTGLILGITDRAVFYMDKNDLFFSFVPFASPVFFKILSDHTWKWVEYVGYGIGIIAVIGVFYNAFKFNKGVISSVSTGLAKLAISFLWILSIFSVLAPSGKNISEKRYKRAQALFIFALVNALMYKLVNGKRVLESRSETFQEAVS